MTTLASTGSIGTWVLGARPRTLALSVTPVAVGLAYAAAMYGAIDPIPIIAALASAIFIQITTNLANDSADGGRGADKSERLGPVRLVGAGIMSAPQVRRGAIVTSLVAVAFGAVAVAYGGAPILAIGLASLLAAWGYSYGPWPISASRFGEVFVILFFGVVATTGIVWLGVHRVDATSALLGIATGLPAAAVLTVNNHRDRVQDAASGRRTLAMYLGPRGTPFLYAVELAAAAAIAGVALWPINRAGAVIAVAAFGFALYLGHQLARAPISRALNAMLSATVHFQVGLAAAIVAVLVMSAR
ncbi:1,4-dihydroxy-2-naphthoate octaprenyltransferase [Bradyrhizobium sp.]|uniref:1,4-dihydroxy-2-naphthoate octaprenyltransferase n=1 Tax=Bradyrhizobium sp. TaxID=376 RepID=UPI00238E1EDF|nr:1,4-dihydroxy-2-naphthoate octaprenyltransferase [Bradyrhizobium sp.]MDE2375770.1 1,4-dihydroxy-2-naphthoate octaprenyltransferase [Bradyrhizobium sp.]